MALFCFILLVVCSTAIPYIDGKVLTNVNEWQRQCCQNCPDITALLGPGALNQQRYSMICQMGAEGRTPYYATFYDKTNRIPVFSKFAVRHGTCPRRNDFWYEGDLIAGIMDGFLHSYGEASAVANINDILLYQASTQDYEYSGYDRGHLNPHNSFCDSDDAVRSTFTYTNVAPQVATFNRGAWRTVEATLRNHALNRCPTTNTFVVGVIPSNNTLNGRVNIPSHFWAYVRCNGYVWIFLAQNENNPLLLNEYLPETAPSRLWNDILSLYNRRTKRDIKDELSMFWQKIQPFAVPSPKEDVFPESFDYVPVENNSVENNCKSVIGTLCLLLLVWIPLYLV